MAGSGEACLHSFFWKVLVSKVTASLPEDLPGMGDF